MIQTYPWGGGWRPTPPILPLLCPATPAQFVPHQGLPRAHPSLCTYHSPPHTSHCFFCPSSHQRVTTQNWNLHHPRLRGGR